jgi:putative lipase involved disintegration of autophagic bodies
MTYVSRAQSANINHIILTGHSAGGAVANLLFLRLLLNAANTGKDSNIAGTIVNLIHLRANPEIFMRNVRCATDPQYRYNCSFA